MNLLERSTSVTRFWKRESVGGSGPESRLSPSCSTCRLELSSGSSGVVCLCLCLQLCARVSEGGGAGVMMSGGACVCAATGKRALRLQLLANSIGSLTPLY